MRGHQFSCSAFLSPDAGRHVALFVFVAQKHCKESSDILYRYSYKYYYPLVMQSIYGLSYSPDVATLVVGVEWVDA